MISDRSCRSERSPAWKVSVVPALLAFMSIIFTVPVTAAEGEAWRQRASTEQSVSSDDVMAEIEFGREVSARILGKYPLSQDEKIMKYVNLIGKAVAQNSSRPEIEFRFAVLDTGEINAYAAPGGYVFITKGALAQAKDEAEVAAILAHEITHIAEKHIVRELNIHATEDSPVAGFARLIGGATESARVAFAQAVDKAVDMLFKDGYKREDEVRADRGATLLAVLTGYDPSAFARYLERIGKIKSSSTQILDKTHPAFDARIALVKEAMANEGVDASALKTNKERFAASMKD